MCHRYYAFLPASRAFLVAGHGDVYERRNRGFVLAESGARRIASVEVTGAKAAREVLEGYPRREK
jgi:hypothetical protein